MVDQKHIFWGEVAPTDHFLQFYESDEILLNSLEAYVMSAFALEETIVIIATDLHLQELHKRLKQHYNLAKQISRGKYTPLNAEMILSEIMTGEVVDTDKFNALIDKLLDKVNKIDNNKIRIFGELVALLWGQGNRKAVVALEKLWHQLCTSGKFSLFCAYPKTGFRQDAIESIHHICSLHNKLLHETSITPEMIMYGEKFQVVPIE